MTIYIVRGAEMSTGKDRTLSIKADDESDAARAVNAMGVVVASVSPEPHKPTPTRSIADSHEPSSTRERSKREKFRDGLSRGARAFSNQPDTKRRKRMKPQRFSGLDVVGIVLFVGGLAPVTLGLWLMFNADAGVGDMVGGGTFVIAGALMSSIGIVIGAVIAVGRDVSKKLARIAESIDEND